MRKIASTAVALQCGTSAEAKLITQQMSHTPEVHAKYYEQLGRSSHASIAFHAMERIRKGEKGQKGKGQKGEDEEEEPAQRKKFPPSETEQVREYFAPAILARFTPTLGECGEFLRSREIDRTKKQIQDKVKNLMKTK